MALKRIASPTLVLVGLAVMAVGVPARQGFWPFTRLRDPTGLEEFQYLVAINFKSPAVCERIDRHVMSRTGGGGWDSPRGFDVQAPAPDGFRPANPVEVLYQMVAVDTPDPSLCARVSPNATLVDYGGKTALLRSRCYVSIAYNTRDQSLCDQLPRLGSSPYVIDYDSLEGCRTTVAIYRRPGFNRRGLRDGFMPFAHASDFTDALRQIGQATPTASQLENLEDDDYWQFVTRLSREGKPEERAEFVRRTLTLQ